MEVRTGYKQTEVGVIPEDWDVKPLSGIVSTPITDGPHLTPAFLSDGIPFLSVNNLVDNRLDLTSLRFVSREDHEQFSKKCRPRRGDILFGKAASVGQVALIDTDTELNIWSPLALIRVGGKASPRFIVFALQTRDVYRQIALLTNASSQGNIGMSDIGRIAIPVPDVSEQTAIATALSDIDALLSGLDRLIAKKRDLKQAAMQQLLTGQTRLPGFRGEWEVKRLGDVVDTDPENLSSETRPDFAFNYIALEDVDRGLLRSHSQQRFVTAPSRARRKLRLDDVLVSTVRPNLQSHLLFRAEGGNWVCSTGFCVVRCRQGVTHPGYIFSHLFANEVNRQIEALLTGSNYPAINSGDVRALEIPLPDFAEQAAIAAVLSDIDAELSALEARRDKTRDLKQAMMQELLTGKTRLVPTGATRA